MKLLVVALCLAAGPNFFIRCEVGNDTLSDENGEKTVDGDALMNKLGQIKDDLNEKAAGGNDTTSLESNKTDSDLDESDIGGKALNGDDEKALLSNRTDTALDELDIGGRKLIANDDGEILRFGKRGEFVAKKTDILGQGGFGQVYKALDTTTGKEVAVKVESKDAKGPSLLTESKNYEIIGDVKGIPHIYYSGTSSDGSQVLVMQLLGSSLADLQKKQKKQQFSPKTVYMIGVQLLERIEKLHKKRLVHRDIKPGNMGIAKSGKRIYIYDFGMSKKYVDDDGKHIPEGPTTDRGSGDWRFMSAYAHKHRVMSRRDDLWAIGFVLMSFLDNDLPWYKVPRSDRVKSKEKLNIDDFCKGHSKQMARYFKYLDSKLDFKTKPDYSYLQGLFKSALSDIGQKNDKAFDWNSK